MIHIVIQTDMQNADEPEEVFAFILSSNAEEKAAELRAALTEEWQRRRVSIVIKTVTLT